MIISNFSARHISTNTEYVVPTWATKETRKSIIYNDQKRVLQSLKFQVLVVKMVVNILVISKLELPQ